MRRFGVVALQGDFAAHLQALRALGVEAIELRRCHELDGLTGVVLPGGESTTLLNLMGDEPWFEELRRFHALGGGIFGTCAGAILLSRDVIPSQPSLGLLDAVVERNAYGRQRESFEVRLTAPGLEGHLEGVFIRAPRFVSVGTSAEILARYRGDPVLVRQGRVLAATFHPELTGSLALHRLFLESVRSDDRATTPLSNPAGRPELGTSHSESSSAQPA
jgi:5'-phosphate synthase pdxT subunit